jgi:hypothetical protein
MAEFKPTTITISEAEYMELSTDAISLRTLILRGKADYNLEFLINREYCSHKTLLAIQERLKAIKESGDLPY